MRELFTMTTDKVVDTYMCVCVDTVTLVCKQLVTYECGRIRLQT